MIRHLVIRNNIEFIWNLRFTVMMDYWSIKKGIIYAEDRAKHNGNQWKLPKILNVLWFGVYYINYNSSQPIEVYTSDWTSEVFLCCVLQRMCIKYG